MWLSNSEINLVKKLVCLIRLLNSGESVCLPVGPCSLWSQLQTIWRAVIVHDLRQTKVGDLYLPTCCAINQQYVPWECQKTTVYQEILTTFNENPKRKAPWSTGLEVVVDDGRPNLVEILESVDELHDDGASLLLGHRLILLQVEIQIVASTVLQHCAEPGEIQCSKQFCSN